MQTATHPQTEPTIAPDPVSAYGETLKARGGFVLQDSPLRPARYRMPLAATIVGALTIATLFGGIGFAVGIAIAPLW